jgi:hypothetical protein
MAYGKSIDFSSPVVVVIDQRPCPIVKDGELLFHEFRVVIQAALSVPDCILPQPAADRRSIAIKNYEGMNGSDRINILSLTDMPWYAVQNEHVLRRESGLVACAGNDLSCKGKVPILEQRAMFKDVPDKCALRIYIAR